MSDIGGDDLEAPRTRTPSAWRAWAHRDLPDGRLLALEPLLFGVARLHVVEDERSTSSVSIYDFQDLPAAVVALAEWDGAGDPDGWYRHRPSDRRRPGGDPANEQVAP